MFLRHITDELLRSRELCFIASLADSHQPVLLLSRRRRAPPRTATENTVL